MADADIGVVLDDLGLLVLDPDGPAGGQALAEADVVLPPTYEVHRTDGRWAAPVPVAPTRLPSSVSSTGPDTCHPGLDWLTAGLVVVPGSVHKSGTASPDLPRAAAYLGRGGRDAQVAL